MILASFFNDFEIEQAFKLFLCVKMYKIVFALTKKKVQLNHVFNNKVIVFSKGLLKRKYF